MDDRTRKTNRLTYSTIKKLERERMITIQKKANLRLCKLSLENPQIIALTEYKISEGAS